MTNAIQVPQVDQITFHPQENLSGNQACDVTTVAKADDIEEMKEEALPLAIDVYRQRPARLPEGRVIIEPMKRETAVSLEQFYTRH